ISSTSQFDAVAGAIETKLGPNPPAVLQDVIKLITFDATAFGGKTKAAPNLNTLLRYGSPAALELANTHDIKMAPATANAPVNPHVRYSDSAANGYGVATFAADQATLTLVTIERPIVDRGGDGAEERGRAEFTLAAVNAGDKVVLDAPKVSGEKPFPDAM